MENRARMGKITITLREDHLPEGIVLAGKCRILTMSLTLSKSRNRKHL